MALPRSLGRALFSGKTTAALAAGAGLYGFGRGVNDRGTTTNMMDFTFGDPEFDRYALGNDFGIREMLMPIPYSMSPFNGMTYAGARNTAITTGIGGGILGGAIGGGVGAARGWKTAVGMGILGAALGTAGGGYAGFQAYTGGTVNRTTLSDAFRARRYDNRMPVVDGSAVFGMYNSRMGGY